LTAERDEIHGWIGRGVKCEECGLIAGPNARGWIGLRCEWPGEEERPAFTFYCPDCAAREFGSELGRRRR
jgi:hypothetical protein